jgi:hypothetical protein
MAHSEYTLDIRWTDMMVTSAFLQLFIVNAPERINTAIPTLIYLTFMSCCEIHNSKLDDGLQAF